MLDLLTHVSIASFLWDIGNQCRTGSPLFAYRCFFYNLNKNEKYHPTTLKLEMDSSNYKDGLSLFVLVLLHVTVCPRIWLQELKRSDSDLIVILERPDMFGN